MGLFFGKKKDKNVSKDIKPFRLESANNSDDSFLISAVGRGASSDYFESPQELQDKTRGYGTNSGLTYVNKYSSTNQKLATSKVVDIGAYKKPVKEAEKKPEPTPAPKPDFEKLEPVAPSFDELQNAEESLVDSEDDEDMSESDFDSFFDEFMKKTAKEKEEPKKVEVKKIEPVVKKQPTKPSVPRKRKKGIDIDIISGGYGGDII